MDPRIFRQYDIRGTVGVDLNTDVAFAIGRAVGSEVRLNGGRSMAVGRDCRLSSPELAGALIDGIRASGVDVLNIGLCTTPLLYFAVLNRPVDGGVMLTGSHNPPDMNGFKIMVGKETIHGEAIQGLLRRIESGNFETGNGSLAEEDIKPSYIDYLRPSVKVNPGMRIGLDMGNGTGGLTVLPILEELGCEVHSLFQEY